MNTAVMHSPETPAHSGQAASLVVAHDLARTFDV